MTSCETVEFALSLGERNFRVLTQMSPRERVGYFGLIALLLGAFGFVGTKQLKKAPELKLEEIPSKSPSPNSPASSEVVVHVVGAVNRPGVLHLRITDRVADAIEKSGGAKANAALDELNLAAPLADGTQIRVPVKGGPVDEIVELYRGGTSESYSAKPSRSSSAGGRSGRKNPTPTGISLNRATQAQLETLPGVGPATAKKILDYRMEHGGFSSVEELLAVKGIGPKKLGAMRKFLKL